MLWGGWMQPSLQSSSRSAGLLRLSGVLPKRSQGFDIRINMVRLDLLYTRRNDAKTQPNRKPFFSWGCTRATNKDAVSLIPLWRRVGPRCSSLPSEVEPAQLRKCAAAELANSRFQRGGCPPAVRWVGRCCLIARCERVEYYFFQMTIISEEQEGMILPDRLRPPRLKLKKGKKAAERVKFAAR